MNPHLHAAKRWLFSLILLISGLATCPLGAQTAARQVDIVFVHDDSGSLNTAAAKVKSNITAFANQLSGSSLNWRLALLPYGGRGVSTSFSDPDGTIKNNGDFFTTVSGFTGLINQMKFDGGDERAFDALHLAATQLNWRSSALKVIILVTDEPNASGLITETTVTNSLVSGGFLFIGMTNGHAEFNRIATATNGSIYSITADFGPVFTAISNSVNSNYYNIATTVSPAGAGSVVGAGEYALGTNASLLAAPNIAIKPYVFLGWREAGASVSTSQAYSFQVTGNRTLEAVFDLPSYPVSVAANEPTRGSVSGAGSIKWGESATLTATANPGFVFRGWSIAGQIISTNPSYNLVVTGAVTATAVFKNVATVTVNAPSTTYNGAAKTATATTQPAGLPVTLHYAGGPAGGPPTNGGTYAVTATAENTDYYGVGTATLTIAKAAQTITFASLLGEGQGNTVPLGATASSGLPVSYTSSDPTVATIQYDAGGLGTAVIQGPGTTFITASQAGNQNFLPAVSQQRVLAIGLLIPAPDSYQIPAGSTSPITFNPTDNDGGNQTVVPVFNPQPGTVPTSGGANPSYPIFGQDGGKAGEMVFNPSTGSYEFTPQAGYRGVAIFTYRLTSLPDAYEQRFTGPTASGGFGRSMVIDGNFAVVADSVQDKLYTYTRSGVTWTYTGTSLPFPGTETAEWFGESMVMDNTTLVVGSPGYNGPVGSVYVYQRNGSTLTFLQKLDTSTAGLSANSSEFGSAVALSGNRILVGAPGQTEVVPGGPSLIQAGAAFIFERNSGTGLWGFLRKFSAPSYDRASYDNFGRSVAFSGNQMLIGVPGCDDQGTASGKVSIFRDFGFGVLGMGTLLPPGVEQYDTFGTSMAAHGNRLVIGAPGGGLNNVGAAFLYEQTNGAWTLAEQFEAEANDYSSNMGYSVAISDEYVVAGAPNSNRAASFAGATYMFRDEPGGWERLRLASGLQAANRRWSETVAIDDGTLMVAEGIGSNDRKVFFINLNLAYGPKSTVTLQIGNPNVAPQITSTPPVSAPGNQRFAHQVVVNDPDDATFDLDFTLENAPRGMIISPRGKVLWYPALGSTTSGDVTVVVKDGGENGAAAARQTFRVNLTSNGVFRFAFFPFDELFLAQPISYYDFLQDTDLAGMADDGMTVAGNNRISGIYGGYLWNRNNGFTKLPTTSSGGPVFASSISGDGEVVAGFQMDWSFDPYTDSHVDYAPLDAYLWQVGLGYRRLDNPHPNVDGAYHGWVRAMDFTGDYAVGELLEDSLSPIYGDSAATWAGVYRESLLGEGDLSSSASGFTYQAVDINGEGSIVVGERHAFNSGGVTQKKAVRWQYGSMEELSENPELGGFEEVHAMRGYDVVGSVGNTAVIWHGTYPFPLPSLPATTGRAVATALSEGAGKIVGFHETATGPRAFYVTGESLAYDLQDEMASDGIVLGQYKLTTPSAISADGTILIGNGTKYGSDTAWMVEMLDSSLFPPLSVEFANGSYINENQPAGTVVGKLRSLGGLVGEQYAYDLPAGEFDNDLFVMGGANGDEVTSNASFDYESRTFYSIKVISVDSIGASVEQVLRIDIGNLYEEAVVGVSVEPAGEGSVQGAGVYNHGNNANLIASPAGDFIAWMENGSVVSTAASYTFRVTASRNLTARFKLPADILVTGTDQIVSGNPSGIGVTTNPPGLNYQISYANSATLPTGPGEFPYVVTIQDAQYKGVATGTFNLKHAQTIQFPHPGSLTNNGQVVPLFASSSSGLPVTVACSNPAVASVIGGSLQVLGQGLATLTATQPGNAEYAAAAPVEITIVVQPNSQEIAQILFPTPPVPAPAWGITGNGNWRANGSSSAVNNPVLETGAFPAAGTAGLQASFTGPVTLRWSWRVLDADSRFSLLVDGNETRSLEGDTPAGANWVQQQEIQLGHGIWNLEWRFEAGGNPPSAGGELADFEIVYGDFPVSKPMVSNLSVQQISGTHLVEISYDLADGDSQEAYIYVQGSSNSGSSWNLPMTHVRGHVGPGVAVGTGRKIIWDLRRDFTPEEQSSSMRVRVLAYDYPDQRPVAWAPVVENGFARIPYGAFRMGDAENSESVPVRDVNLKPYSIGIHEVTNQEAIDVFNWAIQNGHFDTSSPDNMYVYQGDLVYRGSSIFQLPYTTTQIQLLSNPYRLELRNWGGQSTAAYANHPCAQITHFGAALFCHYRNLRDGLESPYQPHTIAYDYTCDFSKTGDRLPTETEWEKAARGDTQTRFPWGETGNHSQANYRAWPFLSYDEETVAGYHPTYGNYNLYDGTKSAPVNAFQANGFGLHQVVGNVSEWCWDIYQSSLRSSSIFDPQGTALLLTSNYGRVLRGGSWKDILTPLYARRGIDSTSFSNVLGTAGFRIARSEPFDSQVTSTHFAVDTRASILVSPPSKLLDTAGAEGAGFGSLLSVDGTRVLVSSAGKVHLHELQPNQTWAKTASIPIGEDESPRSLSLGELYAAVSTADGVKIFSKQPNGSWPLADTLSVPAAADQGITPTYSEFGTALALDGSRLAVARVVGIAGPDGITTASERVEALIFELQPDQSWLYQTKMAVSREAPEFMTGASLALQGDTLALGSFRQVNIFVRDGSGNWNDSASLLPNSTPHDGFGSSVSLSGDWLAVNAQTGLSLFRRDPAGSWNPHQELPTAEILPGNAPVGISGQIAVAGGAEKLWIWRLAPGGQWVADEPITAFDGILPIGFGAAVGLAQDWVLVGAPLDFEMGADSGSVYALLLNDGIAIPDGNLLAALRIALAKPSGSLTAADMLTLTNLNLSGLGLTDLSGLETAANLRILNLRGNAFADPAALWSILDQLTLYCLYVDVPRPGNNPPGLLTQTVTDNSGGTFFITVDALNLPTLDVSGLDIDTVDPANQSALQVFSSAGINVIGVPNYPPVAGASATVLDLAARSVRLDGGSSSDPDGSVVSWAWTWPGGSATGASPTVTLPAGTTIVTLNVTDDDGASAETTVSVSLDPGLSAAFSAAGLSGSDALPDAQPFDDGVPNVLKYAFNMNLAGPDTSGLAPGTGTSGLPSITTPEEAPQGTLHFEFLRRKGSGLVYTPQKSTTLDGSGGWSSLAATPVVTSINDQWERVTYTEAPDPVPATSCFGRVSVSVP